MTKPWHINIREKKKNIDALFDSRLQANLIPVEVIKKLGLEVCGHPNPYPLGCVYKDVYLKVTKQYKIRFVIGIDFIEEVDLDVAPLDVCGVMYRSPYMYMHDAIFMRRANRYQLIKDVQSFIIKMHKGKSKISLVSANEAKILIRSSKKCFFYYL